MIHLLGGLFYVFVVMGIIALTVGAVAVMWVVAFYFCKLMSFLINSIVDLLGRSE